MNVTKEASAGSEASSNPAGGESRAREVLDRIRSRRMSGGSVDTGAGGKSANERRRELQLIRQRSRGVGEGKSGEGPARSPTRSRNLRMRTPSSMNMPTGQAQDGDESILNDSIQPDDYSYIDDDEEQSLLPKKDENNMDDLDDEFPDIVTSQPPVHLFPLSVTTQSRKMEQVAHPLLVFPEPRPLAVMGTDTKPDTRTWSERMTKQRQKTFDEIYVLREKNPARSGYSYLEYWGQDNMHDPRESDEHQKLLHSVSRMPYMQESDADGHVGDIEMGLQNQASQIDGLYVDEGNKLTDIFLSGAEMAGNLATLVPSSMHLSRVTQRVLRDLETTANNERVRKLYNAEIRAKKQPMKPSGEVSPRRKSTMPTAIYNERALAGVYLLKQLGAGPVFKAPESMINEQPVQPVIPKPSVAYGGELGQWSEDATAKERLGVIAARFDSKKVSRSVLRIHLHTLTITNHALMSLEEQLYNRLRRVYAQYRAAMQQRAVGYMAYRLYSIILELSRITKLPEGLLDDDDYASLKMLYRDLLETLPAVCGARAAVDSLTATLYQTWRDIQETRRKQGFHNTAALLIAKPITRKSMQKSGSSLRELQRDSRTGADLDDDDGDDTSTEVDEALQKLVEERAGTSLFKEALQSLPALVNSIQELFQVREHARMLEPDPTSRFRLRTESSLNLNASRSNPMTPNSRLGSRKAQPQGRTPVMTMSVASGGYGLISRDPDMKMFLDETVTGTIRNLVDDSVKELTRYKTLLPDYVVKVSNNGDYTPDSQVQSLEYQRRQMIAYMRFKAVVKVNGKEVTRTPYLPVNPQDFSIDLGKYVEIRVVNRPDDICVDLYTLSPGMCIRKDSFVATIPISHPGQSEGNTSASSGSGTTSTRGRITMTHSYAPITKWNEFSSLECRHRINGVYAGSEAPPKLEVDGALLCTTEYDVASHDSHRHHSHHRAEGTPHHDLALMPPPMLTDAAGIWANSLTDFARERDFQKLLPNLREIDFNDPRHEGMVLAKLKGPRIQQSDVFQLSGLDFSTVFTEDGDSFRNYVKYQLGLRFKLLQLRERKPYLFSAPIPLSEKDIKASELYKQILLKHREETSDPDDGYLDGNYLPTDPHNKYRVSNFLQRVRGAAAALDKTARKKTLVTSSVVAETDYFETTKEEMDLALFARKRDLKPKAKKRIPQAMHVDRCELLVQVVGAKNVPLRAEAEMAEILQMTKSQMKKSKGVVGDEGALITATGDVVSSPRGPEAGDGQGVQSDVSSKAAGDDPSIQTPVSPRGGLRSTTEQLGADPNRPMIVRDLLDEEKLIERSRANSFVEVKFQEHTVHTTSLGGGTPLWKQSMSAPFRPPQNDYTPTNLLQVRDDVIFTLFDQEEEDDAHMGGFLEGESSERIEKRFLGVFQLPFSTLYREQRIEGLFRLQTPLFNFGYDHKQIKTNQRRAKVGDRMFEQDELEVQAPLQVKVPWYSFTGIGNMIADFFTSTQAARANRVQKLREETTLFHPETRDEFEYYASCEDASYVKVMLTLEPLLVPAPDVESEITVSTVCSQDRFLAGYAQRWLLGLRSISANTAERKFTLFGMNSEGLRCLVPRYLTPIKPPPGFTTRRSVIHLCTLFPYISDSQAFFSMDLWCNVKQTWEIGAGDEEEHGVMLYNYLYYLAHSNDQFGQSSAGAGGTASKSGLLGVAGGGAAHTPAKEVKAGTGYPSDDFVKNETVFLVNGRGIPEGDTVYVLLRDTRKRLSDHGPEGFLLINPVTGHMYSAIDEHCPLKEVNTVSTPYNIWANIQPDPRPAHCVYDFLNTNHWRPFFGARLPPPMGGLRSIQEDVSYAQMGNGDAYAISVEKLVRQAIKTNLRRWRSKRARSTTTLHPDASAIVHDFLPSVENWCRTGNIGGSGTEVHGGLDDLQQAIRDRMKAVLRTRTLRGIPVNIPFSDVSDVIAKVKSLRIHETKHPEVQFVLAVRAFPISGNIVSLWIFLGTLETKKPV